MQRPRPTTTSSASLRFLLGTWDFRRLPFWENWCLGRTRYHKVCFCGRLSMFYSLGKKRGGYSSVFMREVGASPPFPLTPARRRRGRSRTGDWRFPQENAVPAAQVSKPAGAAERGNYAELRSRGSTSAHGCGWMRPRIQPGVANQVWKKTHDIVPCGFSSRSRKTAPEGGAVPSKFGVRAYAGSAWSVGAGANMVRVRTVKRRECRAPGCADALHPARRSHLTAPAFPCHRGAR